MAKANRRKEQTADIADKSGASYSAYQKFLDPVIARTPSVYQEGRDERDYLTKGYKNFAETGGMSDDDMNRLRDSFMANLGAAPDINLPDFAKERGVYNEFSDTGGYAPGDIQRIRAQAASASPSLYKAMKDQYALNRSNLGANAAAGAGIDFKGMREQAKQGASDRLTANIGLKEAVNKGRETGAAGLTTIDTAMGNQAIERGNVMSRYGSARAEGLADIEKYGIDNKMSGLDKLKSLYGMDYQPDVNNMDNWLKGLDSQDTSARGWKNLDLTNDATNKSKLLDNIKGGIGAAGGAISAAKGLGLWDKIKNLFKSKPGPTGGTGSGGGGGESGGGPGAGDKPINWGDPNRPPTKDEQEMARLQEEYRKNKQGSETFEQWFQRVYGGGNASPSVM